MSSVIFQVFLSIPAEASPLRGALVVGGDSDVANRHRIEHLFMALNQGDVHDDAFLRKIEIAVLWLLFAGTWVALSRLWGELAEMNGGSKQKTDPTS